MSITNIFRITTLNKENLLKLVTENIYLTILDFHFVKWTTLNFQVNKILLNKVEFSEVAPNDCVIIFFTVSLYNYNLETKANMLNTLRIHKTLYYISAI